MLKLLSWLFQFVKSNDIARPKNFIGLEQIVGINSLNWLSLSNHHGQPSCFVKTKVFDLDAFKEILADFNTQLTRSNRICSSTTFLDLRKRSFLKAFTGGVLEHCIILASAKMNSLATFIVEKNNMIEIVQPVKIHLKYWCQLEK